MKKAALFRWIVSLFLGICLGLLAFAGVTLLKGSVNKSLVASASGIDYWLEEDEELSESVCLICGETCDDVSTYLSWEKAGCVYNYYHWGPRGLRICYNVINIHNGRTYTKDATCTETGETYKQCVNCDAESVHTTLPALGHAAEAVADKAATCTAAGYTGREECSRCGAVVNSGTVLPALGHAWGAYAVTTAPTCTDEGIETSECSRCGETQTRALEALGHVPVIDPAVDPTCTVVGKTEGSHCSRCLEVLTPQEDVPALGHKYGSYVVTTPATCTADGIETATCTRCLATSQRVLPALGHDEVEDLAIPATCTQAGTTSGSHCARCDAVLKAQTPIPALGHAWGAYVVTTPAACLVDGVETRTCSRCQATETRGLTALGHSPVVDVAVEATCTESGLTAGSHCVRCGTDIVKQEIVPALGHSWGEYVQTKAPTCTTLGEERATCSRCGKADIKYLPSQHTGIVSIPAVDPTCTEDGNKSGSRCTDCGVVLVAPDVLPALGHNFGAYVETTPATCTENGEETSTCSRCGDRQTRTIEALGHDWSEYIATTPATCTANGVETSICSRCGEERSRNVNALGHAVVTDAAVPATCTQAGLTSGSHCSRCDTVLIAQNLVPALGHNYSVYVQTAAPTCTQPGAETATCTRCGDEQTRTIDALEHSWSAWDETRESCEVAGERVRICTVCGEEERQILAAGEHSWDDGVITKAPTCTETGSRIKNCSLCGETMTDTVPALGHDMQYHAAAAATETAGGNVEYWQCGRCGLYFADAAGKTQIAAEDTLIPPLGPGDADEDEGGMSGWQIALAVTAGIVFLVLVGITVKYFVAKNGGSAVKNRAKRPAKR